LPKKLIFTRCAINIPSGRRAELSRYNPQAFRVLSEKFGWKIVDLQIQPGGTRSVFLNTSRQQGLVNRINNQAGDNWFRQGLKKIKLGADILVNHQKLGANIFVLMQKI